MVFLGPACINSRKPIVKYSAIWGEPVVKVEEKLAMVGEFTLRIYTTKIGKCYKSWLFWFGGEPDYQHIIDYNLIESSMTELKLWQKFYMCPKINKQWELEN